MRIILALILTLGSSLALAQQNNADATVKAAFPAAPA